jgi:hypothetical protein
MKVAVFTKAVLAAAVELVLVATVGTVTDEAPDIVTEPVNVGLTRLPPDASAMLPSVIAYVTCTADGTAEEPVLLPSTVFPEIAAMAPTGSAS